MSAAPELLALAGQVDAVEAAGRMIARPERAMISRAEILALAIATEKLWEVALEAQILVLTLEQSMPWATTDDEHAERCFLQAGHLNELLKPLIKRKDQDHGTD